jgi:predicted transcriptional regulator
MILVTDVLKAISDNRSLELFRIVALTRTDSDTLISKTKLTCKQYYSRMSRLMNAGLIKRKNGKYTLTAFGKVHESRVITKKEMTNKPDYNEDKDQVEEEQEQETGETTINQVF